MVPMPDMPIMQWYFVIDTSGSMAGERDVL